MLSRTNRGLVARWWWTVDRPLLAVLIALMFGGLVLSLAGSPPVADRLKLSSFHFVERHAVFLLLALGVLIGTSMLSTRMIRRLAMIVLLAGLVMMVLTVLIGDPIKGAQRWLHIGSFAIQPSEFVKPAFAVVIAWLFAQTLERPDMPGQLLAILLVGLVAGLLVLQPDFGQTALIVLIWGAVFFAAGMSMLWIVGLGMVGLGGIFSAYILIPHVRSRFDRFLNPDAHDTYQTDTAIEAFVRGGWFGQGPGEGTVKRVLPDSHTDFVFAVAAEEFGIIVCLVLVSLFAFVVIRSLYRAMEETDAFNRLAVVGLVALFGLQSVINMAVNLSLVPAKGMTLPFISYGGSSLLSLAFAMGMVLALTRRRPQVERSVPVHRSSQPTAFQPAPAE